MNLVTLEQLYAINKISRAIISLEVNDGTVKSVKQTQQGGNIKKNIY